MLRQDSFSSLRTDVAQWELPPRALGPLRLVGLVPMGFAVFFAWMPATQILRTLERGLSGTGSGGEWFLVVFLSVFVLAAMLPFGLGLFILAGRTRVRLNATHLITTEVAGPFRWSRRAKLDDIRRIESGAPRDTAPAALAQLGGIAAVLANGRKFPIAVGYPPEALEPVLQGVSAALAARGNTVPVEAVNFSAKPGDKLPTTTEARDTPPAGTNATVTNFGWTVEVLVPSRGLWKESYGLLSFGILWSVFVGVFTAIVLASSRHKGIPLPPLLFIGVFDLIGVGMILTGVHLGTRQCVLRADRGELHVVQKTALRSREWRWAATDVENVAVGDSGTRVNKRVIEQLQVHVRTAKRPTGLLSGRDHDELAWIATVIRRALGRVSADEPAEPPRIDAARSQR